MRRKLLFTLGLSVGIALLAGLSWVGYLVHAATRLPDWYDAEAVATPDTVDSAPVGWVIVPDAEAAGGDADPAEPRAAGKGKRRQLRNFHLRSAAGKGATREAIRGSRATYEDGRLEAGVVINVSKVDRSKLGKADREFYTRVLEAFPRLKNRDVYIGIEDAPVSEGGYLQLGPETRVHVGKLDYSLRKVARKLGVSEAKVRNQIDKELIRLEVTDPDAPPPARDEEEVVDP